LGGKLARFAIGNVPGKGGLNGQVIFRGLGWLLGFPPATRPQRLADRLTAHESIDPDRAITTAVFSSFVPVVTSFQMPSIDIQHN
jgi:hypothetical protein